MTNPLEFLAPEPGTDAAEGSADGRERGELLVARRGECLFGIFAAESDGIVEWKEPAPLPKASPAVQGLICVRGRMFTVIDPASFTGVSVPERPNRFAILLKGPDQIALGVERVSSITEIFLDEIESKDEGSGPIVGQWADGAQNVIILDPHRLFPAASGLPA